MTTTTTHHIAPPLAGVGHGESNGITGSAGHRLSHRHTGRNHGPARGQGGQRGEAVGTHRGGRHSKASAPPPTSGYRQTPNPLRRKELNRISRMTKMKKPKQKTIVRKTINAWCAELGMHPQTLTKILARVPAGGSKGRFATYDLKAVRAAIEKHDAGKRQRRGTSDDLLRERIRSIDLRNQIADGTLIEHDRVKSAISVLLSRIDQLLEQKLVAEFPSSVAGLDVAQAKIFGKRLTDDLLAEFATCRKAFSI